MRSVMLRRRENPADYDAGPSCAGGVVCALRAIRRQIYERIAIAHFTISSPCKRRFAVAAGFRLRQRNAPDNSRSHAESDGRPSDGQCVHSSRSRCPGRECVRRRSDCHFQGRADAMAESGRRRAHPGRRHPHAAGIHHDWRTCPRRRALVRHDDDGHHEDPLRGTSANGRHRSGARTLSMSAVAATGTHDHTQMPQRTQRLEVLASSARSA